MATLFLECITVFKWILLISISKQFELSYHFVMWLYDIPVLLYGSMTYIAEMTKVIADLNRSLQGGTYYVKHMWKHYVIK